MDDATKRRLTLGFLSGWVSRLAGSLIQLVQVPLFLHFWSASLYGEWLIVSALPSYLSFSNVGFGSVASNEMTMLMAREDRDGALRVFQSCWWLISGVCVATILLLAAALALLPVAHWLPLHQLSNRDTAWILFALGTAVLFGQLEQLLGAAYTCVGRYPYGSFIKSVITLCAFAAMVVPVMLGHGPRDTAIVFGAANVVGTVVLGILVRHDMPWIEFGWSRARWSEIRRLTGPAFAFMGFPIGNALNLNGTLLAVGYALGPRDVAIFGVSRTVSRVALQMVQLVNQTFWPELSAAFGAGHMALVRTMHRRAFQMAVLLGLGLIAVMMVLGPLLLSSHWTAHKLPPSRGLLFMLMVSVVFYAGWSTSSTLLTAVNRHQTLAMYYLGATGVTVAVTYFAAKHSGMIAAAASLILSELIMNFYVLPASLKLSEDSWAAFSAAMLTYPRSLAPKSLLARLRRAEDDPRAAEPVEPAQLDM